ncbi:hypothetical protein GPECTOR_8g163 [Gonium pectorale]|uniref:F-box domain-containing protein n=1 Tax=Gonium pectorale TaxID=33097 RepID=A0A150GSM2_GONPE|nr:hypothetical protein GPECTOR_8g163 [Gonium pectorale]|eukprot:KXZ52774.1 hypothetical protein GPECTOR_8g163 [Gonium pectorale]
MRDLGFDRELDMDDFAAPAPLDGIRPAVSHAVAPAGDGGSAAAARSSAAGGSAAAAGASAAGPVVPAAAAALGAAPAVHAHAAGAAATVPPGRMHRMLRWDVAHPMGSDSSDDPDPDELLALAMQDEEYGVGLGGRLVGTGPAQGPPHGRYGRRWLHPLARQRRRSGGPGDAGPGGGGASGTGGAGLPPLDPPLPPAPYDADAMEPGGVDLADAVPGDSISAVLDNRDLLKAILKVPGVGLKDLCRAACVSRLWRRVVDDPAFWRHVCLLEGAVTPEQVVKLCQRHRGVIEELRVQRLPSPVQHMQLLLPNLGRLAVLEVRFSSLSAASFATLSAGLPALRELRLQDVVVTGPTGNPADASLSHPGLTSLSLASCQFGRLELGCSSLQCLSLSSCALAGLSASAAVLPGLTSLHLASTSRLPEALLLTVVTALTGLRTLTIHDSAVSEDMLRGAARSLEQLTSLELRRCAGLALSATRGSVPFAALRSLAVLHCESLSNGAAGLLVEGCAALEDLSLDGCGLASLAVSLPGLRSVSLRGCPLLASLELRCRRLVQLDLGPLFPGGPGTSALKRVVLSSDSLAAIAWRGLSALDSLTLDCPGLSSLALTDCDGLTDARGRAARRAQRLQASESEWEQAAAAHPLAEVYAAAAGPALAPPQPQPQPLAQPRAAPLVQVTPKTGGCPRLRELRLDGCEGLRHARLRHGRLAAVSLRGCRGLLSLRLHTPELGSLALEECGELDVVELAPAGLVNLSLGACCALRDVSLQCPSLEVLSLKGCGSLRSLALACPALTDLDATFCGELRDAALASALSGRPPLQRLLLSVCASLGPGLPPALASLRGLRHLDLSYTSVGALGPVLAGCPDLTSLCLGSCRDLAGEDLLVLLPDRVDAPLVQGPPWQPAGCVLSGLVTLRLGLSRVQTVSLALPLLSTLDLNGCSALRCLELRCPVLTELHLQACAALPADMLEPLLMGLAGRAGGSGGCRGGGGGSGAPGNEGSCERGLALLDAQHAGAFGEAVAAAVAAAALMASVGPAKGADEAGGSGAGGSGAGGLAGGSGGGDGPVTADVGAGSGTGANDGADAGAAASAAAQAAADRDAALLAARDTAWWMLPRGCTVLACGPDCSACGRRNRRAALGLCY